MPEAHVFPQSHSFRPPPAASDGPRRVPATIRRIGTEDLKEALWQGLDDFLQQPSHLVFLGLIYPIVGFLLARAALGGEWVMLLFPIMAGFAIVGPFAAIGIYEISRRRELGEDTSWRHAFAVLRSPSRWSILLLGGILMVLFILWLASALAIYRWAFGSYQPADIFEFTGRILTTPSGWALILVGNAVGFLFALVTLAISAVSFPMLLDRQVNAFTAMGTSLHAMQVNPGPMAMWGVIVAALLVIGSIPLFVGLAVVVPVLGHATWHLYRKVVVR